MFKQSLKTVIRRLSLVLIVVLCTAMVPCVNTYALTAKQQAMKAYAGTKSSQVKFALAYIDSDSIPELVVMTGSGMGRLYGILSYKNGKIVRIYTTRGYDFLSGYYQKTGVFLDKYEMESVIARHCFYRMNGAQFLTNGNYLYYHYMQKKNKNFEGGARRGGNLISNKETYMKMLRTITKGQKCLAFKYYANTAANRSRYLR